MSRSTLSRRQQRHFPLEETAIKKQLTHASAYTKHQKVSICNALVNYKRVELNEGESCNSCLSISSNMMESEGGNKYMLKELKKLVEEEATLQNLSKEHEQELIAALEEAQALKSTGACANRRAAATDATKNI